MDTEVGQEKLFTIGSVSAQTGIPRGALRFYESSGLLPIIARSDSGYRQYDERALQRIEVIRRGRRAFLSLEQIRTLLESAEASVSDAFRSDLIATLDDRRRKLESHIEALMEQRDELNAFRKALSTKNSTCRVEGATGLECPPWLCEPEIDDFLTKGGAQE